MSKFSAGDNVMRTSSNLTLREGGVYKVRSAGNDTITLYGQIGIYNELEFKLLSAGATGFEIPSKKARIVPAVRYNPVEDAAPISPQLHDAVFTKQTVDDILLVLDKGNIGSAVYLLEGLSKHLQTQIGE